MSGRKLLFLILIITVTAGKAQKLMDTGGMAYSRNSVNTTVFRSNSVVSSGKYQYIARLQGRQGNPSLLPCCSWRTLNKASCRV